MTDYVDSSALVKAFLPETERDVFLEFVASSSAIATSRLAYVECRAAFARARRESRIDVRTEASATLGFEEAWQGLAVVELDASISDSAAEIVRRHPIRAGDAIHLASAEAVPGTAVPVRFACWDRRLWDAAAEAGFVMVPSSRP